jgi:hypothetical protein
LGREIVEIAVLPRGRGKTTLILEWMKDPLKPDDEHRIIVCPNNQRAMQLLGENREELESWQFVSYQELDQDYAGAAWSGVLMGRGGRVVLALDDVDSYLRHRFGRWEIALITISPD